MTEKILIFLKLCQKTLKRKSLCAISNKLDPVSTTSSRRNLILRFSAVLSETKISGNLKAHDFITTKWLLVCTVPPTGRSTDADSQSISFRFERI